MLNYDLEFESIFAELSYQSHKYIVGEVYRVPNTNEQLSIGRYDSILDKLSDYNGDVVIGTDQNFNYLDITNHGNTRDLLNTFITAGFIPTITKPTRITHSTATLIDNLYIKRRATDSLASGIITTDISDHLPVFLFLGRTSIEKKSPKVITYRPMDEAKIIT